jgi:predicted HTH transcriptional regulator
MRELNICEERGGGIDKAIIDIEEKCLPAPEFFGSKDSMRAVLFGLKRSASYQNLTRFGRAFAIVSCDG